MPPPRDLPERALILRILDEAFDRNGWHGPTLRAALRGVTPTQAAWKPGVDRHSVWELMLHCAYWKFVARRRLTGERGVPFPRSGRNDFTPPEPHERAWRDDVAMLRGQHHAL
ncbi:MAG: DinB family protein, partial [Acidobacteriota bacterium]